MRGPWARVWKTRRGEYRLRLPEVERELLRSLPAQLRALLEGDDPALERLFPPAYPDEPEREAEYAALTRDDLLRQRLSALEIVEATIDADRLGEEELSAWLGALNDLRLVLGSRLGVTEETSEEGVPDDHPLAPQYALYGYLGWLEAQIVDALAEDPATGR